MKTRWITALSILTGTLVFLVLLVALSRPVYASGVTVSGTVYYSTTPLPDVRVELVIGNATDPPVFSTTTTVSGTFAFLGVPSGNYQLKTYGPTAEYTGWQASPITVGTTDIRRDVYLRKKMTLVSPPQDSVVETLSPLFCWQGLPEAVEYTLQLNKTSDWTLIDFVHHIPATCYRTSQVGQDGVQYAWQIAATDRNGHAVGTTQSAFQFTVNTTPVTGTVQPTGVTIITSRDNNIELRFPSGVVSQTVVVHYARNNTAVTLPLVGAMNAENGLSEPTFRVMSNNNLVGVDRSFYVTATYESTGLPADLLPGASYTITVDYADTETGTAVENTLALYWWDGDQWVKEPSSAVDTINNIVTAAPGHFSLWAVLGETTHRLYLPLVMKNY